MSNEQWKIYIVQETAHIAHCSLLIAHWAFGVGPPQVRGQGRVRRHSNSMLCRPHHEGDVGLKYRVLLGKEDRGARQIAEARFVSRQDAVGILTFGGVEGGREVLCAVPPHFGDAVIGFEGAPGRLSVGVERGVQGMALQVALGPEGSGVLFDQGPVLFQPVSAELFGGESGEAADAKDEFQHNRFDRGLVYTLQRDVLKKKAWIRATPRV